MTQPGQGSRPGRMVTAPGQSSVTWAGCKLVRFNQPSVVGMSSMQPPWPTPAQAPHWVCCPAVAILKFSVTSEHEAVQSAELVPGCTGLHVAYGP